MTKPHFHTPRSGLVISGTALILLGACTEPFDMDLRDAFNTGNGLSTADAALAASADRPQADARGIISYPGYQVAVAKNGDTVTSLANRIGVNADELARYNGVRPDDQLRDGEVVALPARVPEPLGGPILAPVDINSVAGNALDSAESPGIETTGLDPNTRVGVEPIRHKVERGETAFTIARLYNVSIRSLAEWNGLDSKFTVREGQYLLIPVALPGETTEPYNDTTTELPGAGSITPTPPSAATPLPDEDTTPLSQADENTAPDLGDSQTAADTGRMTWPVRGDIIREYSKGKSEGIDIAAAPGTPVKAAAAGVVAAITEDSNGVPIIVIKHPDNLLTVYSNIGNLRVAKGDKVTRGQPLAEIRSTGTAAVHFEVRDGFESVNPADFLS
ncbi:Murein hydrolase activator EnvC [hydrothermal vent metagenome]|uniref:Murein hydrolase activator EnvC n=1 Tax=hydrothermal vent metagenome TaxID=652676 RepID=A0A3B0S8H0_9ZZZZ